MNKKAHASNHM